MLDQSSFSEQTVNDTETAQQLSQTISNKLEKYKTLLAKSKAAVESLYAWSEAGGGRFSSSQLCCDLPPRHLKYSLSFGLAVNKDLVCDTLSRGSDPVLHSFNLTAAFSGNLGAAPGLRWQFYLRSDGREVVYPAWGNPGRPCNPRSIQHDQIFLDTLHRNSKVLVILIDRSQVMTPSKIELAKATAKFVINLLGESDRVAVISLDSASVVHDPFPTQSCLMGKLIPVSSRAKLRLSESVETLDIRPVPGNLMSGLKTAANILQNSEIGEPAQILFLTNGNREKVKKDQVRLS